MKTINKIVPSAIGNFLQWYEFALFSFFSTAISQTFFPSQDGYMALLETFLVFAVGFIVRPLGAVIFGHLGDRIGRKKIMPISVGAMAFSTTAMALLPGHNTIGMMAPIALVFLRIFQGLALGGEYSSSNVYMLEHADPKYKTFWTSFVLSGAYLGYVVAAWVAAAIAHFDILHPSYQYLSWRVPFLLGFILGFVGLYIRKRMPETPDFLALETEKQILDLPIKSLLQEDWHFLLMGIGMTLLSAVTGWFVAGFATTYIVQYGHLAQEQALKTISIAMTIGIVACPCYGYLIDRIGRKYLLMLPAVLLLVFGYPLAMSTLSTSFSQVLLGVIGIFAISNFMECMVAPTLADLFAVNKRCTGIAITVNIANGIFGGTVPAVCLYLIHSTGNVRAPIIYMLCIGVVATCALYAIQRHLGGKNQLNPQISP